MACTRHWIKASISLTVVMGIAWIIGFLVVEVEELFTLAYIFTIFVAFQGVFIFVIFVLLSKQVRENYAKWWKAKLAESDFLSKHFGDKTLGTGLVSDLYTTV
jgi:protein-S-isoprenylcysteine O-methyltransferase Ste14